MPVLFRPFIFLLFVGGLTADALAQPQQWAIQRLTMNEGLPENVITSLTQDQQGFLWVATEQTGLARYDGYGFISYRHVAEDPGSLAHDSLTAVYTDREGTLWVGTQGGGLDRLDRNTDTFRHYPHDSDDPTSLSGAWVTALLEDGQGQYWVGTTAGLNLMDRSTGTFIFGVERRRVFFTVIPHRAKPHGTSRIRTAV